MLRAAVVSFSEAFHPRALLVSIPPLSFSCFCILVETSFKGLPHPLGLSLVELVPGQHTCLNHSPALATPGSANTCCHTWARRTRRGTILEITASTSPLSPLYLPQTVITTTPPLPSMAYQHRISSQPRGRPRMKYAELPVFKYQTYDPNSLSFVEHPIIPTDRIIFSDRHTDGRSKTTSRATSLAPSVDAQPEAPSKAASPAPAEKPAEPEPEPQKPVEAEPVPSGIVATVNSR